jgi:CheY-like chemotaxis protein
MPHTILLCEDNRAIRELVSSLLVDEGYAVREVGELAEADALVGEGEISLVLADSGEGTREAATRAYRCYCRAIGDRVPMIVFTAHRLSVEETRELGCAAVLAKPFDIEQLLSLIEERLSAGDTSGGARAG